MAELHFLRPLWLLSLLALPLLPLMIRQARQGQNGWSRVMPQALLSPLISHTGSTEGPKRSPLVALTVSLLLFTFALAGPTWREAPTPLQQQNDSLVIVLDLSLSMLATDVKPDRLTLAKRKIQDLLKERDGSFTGLVVFAADAHVVTPLTDDRQTIEGLLGVLDPLIMPAAGNRPDLAIQLGKSLLEQGAPGQGRLLLISDDVPADHQYSIRDTLRDSPYSLSTLVVGTPEGGPIPLPKRGFIRDKGEIVITQADPQALAWVAERTGGESHQLTLDNQDIQALNLRARDSSNWQDSDRDLSVSRWQDDGYWLLWLALPLLLLSWRRGALLVLVLVIAPTVPTPAMALEWDDLWSRPEQRGEALINRDPKRAAEQFKNPDWRGSAHYRAGDYKAAAEDFAATDTPDARYNRGNALARAGDLEGALAAYEQVLERRPNHDDARHNRDLVKQLLYQQKQHQQKQHQQKQDQQKKEQQEQDQQNDQSQDGQKNQDQQNPPQNPGGQNTPPNPGQDSGQGQQKRDGESGGNPSPGQGQDDESTNETSEPQQSGDQNRQDQEQPATGAAAPAELETTPLSQGQEQWLRRIPDDPGGLLRRKFLQQYRERETQPNTSDTPW